jgi:predicted DNA-binding helix-hairpin-helix protein
MKLDLTKQELILIFANLSFTLSTLTDTKQRESIEKVMTKIKEKIDEETIL